MGWSGIQWKRKMNNRTVRVAFPCIKTCLLLLSMRYIYRGSVHFYMYLHIDIPEYIFWLKRQDNRKNQIKMPPRLIYNCYCATRNLIIMMIIHILIEEVKKNEREENEKQNEIWKNIMSNLTYGRTYLPVVKFGFDEKMKKKLCM